MNPLFFLREEIKIMAKKKTSKELALLEAISAIANEKEIEKEIVIAALEEGLASAYERDAGNKIDVLAKIDEETGIINYYQIKIVVDKVYDKDTEIAFNAAKKLDPDIEIDDEVYLLLPKRKNKNMSRVAAQITKQIITQKLKFQEREVLYNKFKEKKGTIMTGDIQRKFRNSYYIRLDNSKIEVVLGPRDQIRNEVYQINQKIKFLVLDIKNEGRGAPRIIASRTHKDFVKRLFEFEISEVFDNTIEIKDIAREPGVRCKIGVESHDSNVDPVGTCVGNRGSKIQSIVRELNNERIDIIPYDQSPEVYIKNALKPAQIESVTVNIQDKTAIVVVPKDQYSLAIGKGGLNVRLAARLTGFKLDVHTGNEMSNEEALEKAEALFNSGDEAVEEIKSEE
jgi:N utilization substance protein A